MRHLGGLIEDWVKTVQVTEAERKRVEPAKHPFGTPAEHVGVISNTAAFEKRILRAQLENAHIKTPGQDGIFIPSGFDHLIEPIQMMIDDQTKVNPLFRHARVEISYRQNLTPQTPNRNVHTDPSRTENSVQEDFVYFLSNKQGTIAQAQFVKNPAETLNKMTPEGLIEEGLLKQAEPFEMMRGRQSTFHTQGAPVYDGGRTFLRMIVTHPDVEYFHNLSDREKADLPQDFREKHGIHAIEHSPILH